MFETALQKQRLLARSALERAGKLAFKPVTSAKWCNLERRKNGSILVQIEHDTIKGCTPAMLKWWFENLAQKTTWNGADFSGPEIPFYHLWHHRDHIAITPLTQKSDGSENKGFAVGAKSRIDEQFNDYKDRIHQEMLTTILNEREFTIEIRLGSIVVGRLRHIYEADGDDCTFYSESDFGMNVPILGFLFNWLVLPRLFSLKSGENWIRHNIEESGRTEDVVPVLYRYYVGGMS